jgi:AcrR family transcriptional regulator
MESKRRTQAERSQASRTALVAAARRLFAEHGYAAVGTPEIAAAAGLTRGAMYHQFADKTDLFTAVLEQVETELTGHIAAVLAQAGPTDPLAALSMAAEAWLDASADPEVHRIVLIDAPAVLGWARWREIGQRHGLGLTIAALRQAMAAGAIPEQPAVPLAHLMVGAIDEAALYIAGSPDPDRARAESYAVLRRLVRSLALPL